MIETGLYAFIFVALVATFSPGPAVLLAVSNGANHGIKMALVGISGNVLAMIFYATLASLGLGIILETGGKVALAVIQVLGGLYLAYIGFRALFVNKSVKEHENEHLKPSKKNLFFSAVTVGLSNPKAIIFFSALFPQFIDISTNYIAQATILTAIFALCSFSALLIYASLASKFLRKSGAKLLTVVNKTAGFLFMLLGGGLVYSAVYD